MMAPPARFSWFWCGVVLVTGLYLAFLLALIVSTATYTTAGHLWAELRSGDIRFAIGLSLLSATTSALLALFLAVPAGYLLARARFPGKSWLEAMLDIPIVLPPTVVGLCLVVFFQTSAGQAIEHFISFTYTAAGVVLAQFVVAAAFAVRVMRGAFEHLSARPEEVAMTLGCSRGQAVWLVTLPAAKRGIFAAFSLAWGRSLGEFGPVLVFAGIVRRKTEVLSTSIYLEYTSGHLEAAVAVSLLMVALAILVLVAVRTAGEKV
jgi:molybdate transport system permease protein